MRSRKNIVIEVGSIFVFVLGVFTLFALISYHGSDPSLLTQARGDAKNSCGRVGAYFASSLLEWFGMGGFLIPAALFFVAASIHKKEGLAKVLGTLGGVSIAVSSFTVFITLQWKYWYYGGAQLLTGGIFGVWIADGLLRQLNLVGSSLVALAIFCISVAISTPFSVAQFGAKFLQVFSTVMLRLSKLLVSYVLFWMGITAMRFARAIADGIQHMMIAAVQRTQKMTVLPSENKQLLGPDESHSSKNSDVLPLNSDLNFDLNQNKEDEEIPPQEGENLDLSESDFIEEKAEFSETLTFDSKSSSKGKASEIKILPRETDTFSKIDQKIGKPAFKTRQGQWQLPTIEFLVNPPKIESTIDRDKLIANSKILTQKFKDFGIEGEVTAVRPGPVITLYEFKPGPGVKVSRIAALADDLSMALSAQSVRILAPLPGKSVVGIEIPSDTREIVYLREFIQHPEFYGNKHAIPVVMGKDIGGQTYLSDLARMPHLLCAGQTGSGKSVFMNGLICSLFYRFTPDQLRMILVDPKFIEFRAYQDIPHLLLPVVDDPKQASVALKWAVREMERRYRILAKMGARNLASFNQKVDEMGSDVVRDLLNSETQSESISSVSGTDWIEAFDPDENGVPKVGKLPFIVVIIDELADLMMISKKEVEISIARIAQKARAAGIHLIIATQRPSTDVITGLIKANLPSRVSFQLSSFVDSKTILDRAGAERLLGQGDMLFIPPGVSQNLRLHGAYLADEEINKITSFLKSQGKPAYRDEILLSDEEDDEEGELADEEDDLFGEAVELVKRSGHASASFLQRHLKVGYNRAARMIEKMETRGIVGPQDGSKPREVLIR